MLASCFRKAEVKTSNFGFATVLVWLCLYREVAAPLALPMLPSRRTEVRGWRKEDGGLHAGLTGTCGWIILKTQKQILVLANVNVKDLVTEVLTEICLVLSCCRKA